MELEIKNPGAFGSALITLDPGESFVSEAGAMFRASANVDIDVTTRSRGGSGGIMGGLKRMLGGESFFLSTYTATGGQPGEVGVAPTLQGEVFPIQLDSSRPQVVCAGGSYLASDSEVSLNMEYQGLARGLLGGESLFFVKASGNGILLVNAFGRITPIDVDGELVIDTSHIVAFEETMQYRVTKTNAGWIKSALSGEGLVMHFEGKGRVWVQSHNPKEFGARLGRRLPPRKG
ncbi:MAG: hypothetical protein ACI80K_002547 [Paracoccaceae bacterium]|jgi:uncharacterized protein (TIGR00266 family)